MTRPLAAALAVLVLLAVPAAAMAPEPVPAGESASADMDYVRGVELIVACDVRTHFVDAAKLFGPQKGAGEAAVALLQRRLERLVQVYFDEYGVDVSELEGAGAAGGLAGGLAAIGAELVDGFSVVADACDLDGQIEGADLVITGEGRLDASSFDGKVVGGVTAIAADFATPVAAVVGAVDPLVAGRLPASSLVDLVGEASAFADPAAAVVAATEALLDQLGC